MPISAATRERVRKAAQELGYQPNSFAQALRKNKSSAIAILAFDIVDPYCAHVMRGAEEVIHANDYFPMLFDLQNDQQRMQRCITLFKKRRIEGLLILASSLRVDEAVIAAWRSSNVPVVVIGREVESEDIPTIVTDNVGGGYVAVEHLIQLGHTRIGFILGPSAYIDSRQRWEGGARAMRDHGLTVDDALTAEEESLGWGPEAGYSSMKQLLARSVLPTAVFAFDDVSAFGAIRAICEAGLRVPEDISVVGFDDLSAAAFFNPPLTTVQYSMVDMGKKGAERLLGLIARPGDGASPAKTVEPTRLVVRRSTARLAGSP